MCSDPKIHMKIILSVEKSDVVFFFLELMHFSYSASFTFIKITFIMDSMVFHHLLPVVFPLNLSARSQRITAQFPI